MASNKITGFEQEEEVYNPYQGGGTGVSADFNLRNMFGNAALGNANQATQQQITNAQNRLNPLFQQYQGIASGGMYSQQEMDDILKARMGNITNSAYGQQSALNNMLAQRGVRNPGASIALGNAGQFAAAGERGQAMGDLASQQAQSRLQGLAGAAGIANQLASLDVSPVQGSTNYMDLYNQWRNAFVGQGEKGYDWSSVEKPEFDYGYVDYWNDKDPSGKKK